MPSDREALIDANLASVHVPFFLDGRGTARFRGDACVDGSLGALLQPNPCPSPNPNPNPNPNPQPQPQLTRRAAAAAA